MCLSFCDDYPVDQTIESPFSPRYLRDTTQKDTRFPPQMTKGRARPPLNHSGTMT